MRNIKLTLEYDGADFSGFQRQKNRRSVQAELETALKKVFQRKIKVTGSGRTDAGAHASGQVISCRAPEKIPVHRVCRALNHFLPRDIAVLSAEEAPDSFHAQYSARLKRYEYRVLHSPVRSPLERARAYPFPYPLDLSKMRAAARFLTGTRDFRIFESSGSRRKKPVRTVRKLDIRKQGKIITISIESNGFLYKMVRSIVGTLLSVGSGKLSLREFKNALSAGDRKKIGPTAPACGLFLRRVVY